MGAETDFAALGDADVMFICTPTLFDQMKALDLTSLKRAFALGTQAPIIRLGAPVERELAAGGTI